jgi:hypothetical protein
MNQSQPTTKTTLSEALNWDDSTFEVETEFANASDFDFTAAECSSSSRLWLHLAEIAPGSPLAATATRELLNNPDLFIKLNGPAREFVNWFRREAWDHFDLSEATGSEAWAFNVLNSARAMCAAMGPLALQVPMRLPAGV